MQAEVPQILNQLKECLAELVPPLQIRVANDTTFEVAGTKRVMQGKKQVDGMYFASLVPKPKDVRLYFFPIYTHPDSFELSTKLRKALKGKSCFHIKQLDEELANEITTMMEKGLKIYLDEEWV